MPARAGKSTYRQWALLGALSGLGVFIALAFAAVAERNRLARRGWSEGDIAGGIVLVCVFGGIAIALGAIGGIVFQSIRDALSLKSRPLHRRRSAPPNDTATDPFADRFASRAQQEQTRNDALRRD